MPYDEALAARIRVALRDEPDVTEQKMFGGLAFMIRGNLAVGAGSGGELIVRVTRASVPQLLDGDHVRPMEMRGKPMAGWLLVADSTVATDAVLREWIARGVTYAGSLPAK